MIRAYHLYTGPEGDSHVTVGVNPSRSSREGDVHPFQRDCCALYVRLAQRSNPTIRPHTEWHPGVHDQGG